MTNEVLLPAKLYRPLLRLLLTYWATLEIDKCIAKLFKQEWEKAIKQYFTTALILGMDRSRGSILIETLQNDYLQSYDGYPKECPMHIIFSSTGIRNSTKSTKQAMMEELWQVLTSTQLVPLMIESWL